MMANESFGRYRRVLAEEAAGAVARGSERERLRRSWLASVVVGGVLLAGLGIGGQLVSDDGSYWVLVLALLLSLPVGFMVAVVRNRLIWTALVAVPSAGFIGLFIAASGVPAIDDNGFAAGFLLGAWFLGTSLTLALAAVEKWRRVKKR